MALASSPCIALCTLDEPSGLCLGCGRSLDEIVAWSDLSEVQRLSIMATLPERLAATDVGALDAGAPAP